MKYEIHNYELSETVEVEAPGLVEAMLEYLPWPTVQLYCDFEPHHGRAKVIDDVTGFTFRVRLI